MANPKATKFRVEWDDGTIWTKASALLQVKENLRKIYAIARNTNGEAMDQIIELAGDANNLVNALVETSAAPEKGKEK